MASKKNGAAGKPETKEIATTEDGRDITQSFVGELRQPPDRRLLGAADWGVYNHILKDDQVMSCFQQRRLAVTSRDWDVVPGGDGEADKQAAAALKEDIGRIGWDRITDKMLYGVFYGYSVAELLWTYDPERGRNCFSDIKVRHARRFRIGQDGNWRLITRDKPSGETLPPRKFWVFSTGADNDDEPYGAGLADWLYWPVFFKRNGIKFWLIFLDKFGMPTTKGTYRAGSSKADQAKLLQALRAIQTDSAIILPEGMGVELLSAARSGTADYAELSRYMDGAISKIILSQTMTTDNGSSHAQAQVHNEVKLDVVKADADLLMDSFNAGPAVWYAGYNFPGAAAPRVIRIVEEPVDLKVMADMDAVLSGNGWERTEESFKETYGDGFEKKEAIAPPAGDATAVAASTKDAVPDPEADPNVGDAAEFSAGGGAGPAAGAVAFDFVDELAAEALDNEGWAPLMTPIIQPVHDALEGIDDFGQVEAALIGALAKMNTGQLQEMLARAGFTARIAARVGADGAETELAGADGAGTELAGADGAETPDA